MCGRYANAAGNADLIAEFGVDDVVGPDPGPSWNVAPTDPVRVVVQRPAHAADADALEIHAAETDVAGTRAGGDRVRRQLRTARWGLVPSWSRDSRGGARMINARIETVSEKPAFRVAAARRRALVPALGYYEWQRTDEGKVPHFLADPDGKMLAFAGLYELWRDPALAADDPDRWLWSVSIVTQQATDLLGEIHDRNPVVVPPELRGAWLDCSGDDLGAAAALLARMPAARLAPRVVSAAVGNVRNNGPELIEPVASRDAAPRLPLGP